MELLLFFQNRRFWDIGVVHMAYQGICFVSVKNNMAEDEEFNEMNNQQIIGNELKLIAINNYYLKKSKISNYDFNHEDRTNLID